MSKHRSRSTIPTNNSPRNPSNTDQSTSRQQKHEQSPSPGERPQRTTTSSPPPIPGPSRTRPLPEDESPEEPPMTKRLRRDSATQEKRSDRSSPSTDGGFADTEETGERQDSDKSKGASAAPKKKRTRTLTTPHQSAVLHALLSQSRFPTTAMREEVGRAIGLSARKVQIWFQNQRQKARRPRPQSESSTRPPQYQYGPFPSATDLESMNLYPRPPNHLGRPPIGMSFSEQEAEELRFDPSSAPQQSMSLPPLRLSGPGIPGQNPSSESFARGASPDLSPIAGPSRPTSQALYGRSPSPTRSYPIPMHASSQSSTRPRDPSRTLPPLVFPSPTHPTLPSSIRSAPPTLPPPFPFHHRSLSPETHTHAHHSAPGTSSILPPPFTLQPQPQWDNSTFTASGISVWGTSSYAQTAHREESASPSLYRIAERVPEVPPETDYPPSDSPSNTRGGRYDPIRGSVIPYERTPPPPPPPRTPPAT
ncbi:homeobox-domain-containing protein [Marasmius fiardii PR-910]|nr:homeobox-domain-containing protein [Marasmius fiardii PR-910]